MRQARSVAMLVLLATSAARAQGRIEPLNVGVTAALGVPAGLGAVRVGGPLGGHAGIDVAIGQLTGASRNPACITHVRWIRGGRAESGASRYWIAGLLVTHETSSTLIVFPGNERRTLVERRTLIMPRVGYGWDHVSQHGMRAGLELTTGSAGEEAGLMLANVFLSWGPPR